MKSCFLCDCKSCPNWGIDGYYGLCGEKSRETPDEYGHPEDDEEDCDEED